MHQALDLTQSNWRFHTALGIHQTVTELAKDPAKITGPSSDVVLSFTKHTTPIKLKEDVALMGVWYESSIVQPPEDNQDYPAGKGSHRIKVIPAVNAAGELNQVIQIYQTDYV